MLSIAEFLYVSYTLQKKEKNILRAGLRVKEGLWDKTYGNFYGEWSSFVFFFSQAQVSFV